VSNIHKYVYLECFPVYNIGKVKCISPDVGQSFHVCSDCTVISVDMSLDGQPCSRHCHFSTVVFYSVPRFWVIWYCSGAHILGARLAGRPGF